MRDIKKIESTINAMFSSNVSANAEPDMAEGMQAKFIQVVFSLLMVLLLVTCLSIMKTQNDVKYWKSAYDGFDPDRKVEKSLIDLQWQKLEVALEKIEYRAREALCLQAFTKIRHPNENNMDKFDASDLFVEGKIASETLMAAKFKTHCNLALEWFVDNGHVGTAFIEKKWWSESLSEAGLEDTDTRTRRFQSGSESSFIDQLPPITGNENILSIENADKLQKQISARVGNLLKDVTSLQNEAQIKLNNYLSLHIEKIDRSSAAWQVVERIKEHREKKHGMENETHNNLLHKKLIEELALYVARFFEFNNYPLLPAN